MGNRDIRKINLLTVLAAAAIFIAAASVCAFAGSVPTASGRVDSSDGAVLRKSATVKSDSLAVLDDNTKLKIYKEVFVSKKSTSRKYRWYYVKVKSTGTKGYIRSDLVDSLSFSGTGAKTTDLLNYRKGAGIKMKKIGRFKKGAAVTVCLKATPVLSTKGSNKVWYKIKKGSKYYYVCSTRVKLTKTASTSTSSSGSSANLSDAEFEKYLTAQGFPASYKSKLRKLHKSHPNWVFESYSVNATWSAALAKQTKSGVSLISKYSCASSAYRNGSKQVESGWYNASKSVVAYYMDPRNFLNENRIYMFEDLSYKPSYQTKSVVNAILSPTKLPTYGFTANIFVKAGSKIDVSPVFLAARARQETGGGSDAITGKTSLGKVYNPFNIGAFGGTNPLYNGLIYARLKGWTTPKKAVEGGAAELAKYYINAGQDTIYYQRFNVKNGAGKIGTHQYMTNIQAPYSEAYSTKKSYEKYGIVDKSIVFSIPVYKSMPAKTSLP